ncbi:hypothetical protein [Pseudoalteromonas tunicata]|jgi:hypothetical protein|uniref:Putative orphan protein putative membrane protein n=1 Tax=Pseudoalteromonas tunicata D2 TaxID=87626 RepID=A4CCG7_9GAMM|nr:hypothetical protein [Pseudoalteromonas tunicata]ATC93762.1 hypothetical protein PTUN_a1069 [Pseudoalteromonas tunicata]EAR27260.1 putative orphan protein; putative membrane protein [Pseudoalteromonas tunicata D2]
MLYQKKQFGWAILVLISWVLSSVLLALYVLGSSVPVYLFAAGLVIVAYLFHSLTIKVSKYELSWSFGPGVFGQKIPISAIAKVNPVTNSWLHGLGVKITHDGWVYGVSGFQAIAIELHDGTKFRVGSDDQANLLACLRTLIPEEEVVIEQEIESDLDD